MRFSIFFSLIIIIGCNANVPENTAVKPDTPGVSPDTSLVKPDREPNIILAPSRIYSNKRFRDVRVERIAGDSFVVKGQGQIFEANFGWVVEDGHEELKKGNQMTDAGAPEWGNFEFKINVHKKRANSTLTLILFEVSAKDGSRQYELPIKLY
jgi:hypothetical protein